MSTSGPGFGISSLISDALKRAGLDGIVKEQMCVAVWDEVVGKQVSDAAQPDFVKDGKLFVTTKSPVWANELTFYKKDMIARLNARVGADVLKDIIFKAGRISKRAVPDSAPEAEGVEDAGLEGIQLTKKELEEVEATARAAGDDSSSQMKSLLMTAMRLDKWKKAHGWKPCKRCGVLQDSPSGVCPVCELGS